MKNNINNYQFLLKNFLKSKNHLGLKKKLTQKEIYPFLYGIRSKQCIINLDITINTFKRIFKLIIKVLKNNQKIVLVGNNTQSIIFKNILNEKNIIFISFKNLNSLSNNIELNNTGLFIFLNTIDNVIFLKYINNLNIPIISFFDTNLKINLKNITYPILSNNNNLKSLFFIIYLFRNLLKKNQKK